MRHLITALFCILVTPDLAFAGVSHIKTMTRQSTDDRFDVTCSDGRSEVTSTRKIFDNSVCVTKNEAAAQSSKQVFCASLIGDNFYVTRISDGKKFGSTVPFEDCQRSVKSSIDLVCASLIGDNFYVTRISDGEKFGSTVSLARCLEITSATAN